MSMPYSSHSRGVYRGYAGAFANFFQFGDPRGRKAAGVAVEHPRVRTGKEWYLGADGEGTVGTAGRKSLEERCAFWRGLAANVPI